jgi:hypothetical protein
MRRHMDVFFSDFGIKGLTGAWVVVVTAWDDSVYAECNVREGCGPNRLVDTGTEHRSATVGYPKTFEMNSEAGFRDERPRVSKPVPATNWDPTYW